MVDEPVIPKFGTCFGDEVIAAGIGGLPFAWEPDTGVFWGRENLTTEQNATLDEVIAAHDPYCPGTAFEKEKPQQ